ncbi:hypothetical protein CB1_000350035 [Camelus ferus]|nr:hypothetical protein CB1_000350035 [Camelus ferus]
MDLLKTTVKYSTVRKTVLEKRRDRSKHPAPQSSLAAYPPELRRRGAETRTLSGSAGCWKTNFCSECEGHATQGRNRKPEKRYPAILWGYKRQRFRTKRNGAPPVVAVEHANSDPHEEAQRESPASVLRAPGSGLLACVRAETRPSAHPDAVNELQREGKAVPGAEPVMTRPRD